MNSGLIETNVSSNEIGHFWRYSKTNPTPFYQLLEPNKKRFIALPFILCCLPTNWQLLKKFDTPAPKKILFLDLRPGKRHIGCKKNSKQLLLRCCYTYFCLFPRRSWFCTRVVWRPNKQKLVLQHQHIPQPLIEAGYVKESPALKPFTLVGGYQGR